MEVNFNKLDRGACPSCRKRIPCTIQSALSTAANKIVEKNHSCVMEIVIYKCPEFIFKD